MDRYRGQPPADTPRVDDPAADPFDPRPRPLPIAIGRHRRHLRRQRQRRRWLAAPTLGETRVGR